MALQAMWVHGTTARPQWVDNLDINGLPRGWSYRGKNALTSGFGGSRTTGPLHPATPFEYSQKGCWFHFAIPTPVIVAGRRTSLQRVFMLWEARRGVAPVAVHV